MQIVAFALPLYQKLVAPLLLLWFLVAVSIIITQHKRLIKGALFNPLLILYLLSIVWVLFSEDISLAGKELEIKLSLLLMPLGFYFIGNYLPDKKRVLRSFVSGVFVAIILDFSRALIMYAFTGDKSMFYYTNFSFFMHPGYFAMYIVFAIAIIFQYMVERNEKLFANNILSLVILVLLIGGVFAASSKTGILALGITILGYIFYYAYRNNQWKISLILFAGVIVVFTSVLSLSSKIRGRFSELLFAVQEQPETNFSSTSSRIAIWKTSVELIRDNPIGYGTGMAVPTLKKAYFEKGYHKAFVRKQNAHNQFLQTTLVLGVLGLIVLLWMFVQPLINIKEVDPLFIVLLLMIAFNFTTEAMLERQAGVVFVAFFYSYFSYYRRNKEVN